MPDSKITALTALTAADPANDMIPIVDVSDTPPASGNTKRISINNLLACSPSATLASATITGNLTVDTNTLFVDAANDRVGMGTLTPVAKLIVRDGANRNLLVASDASHLGSAGIAIGSFTDNAADWAPLSLVAKTSIAFGLNGSTAMTLNATGLGVGDAPATNSRLTIGSTNATGFQYALRTTGITTGRSQIYLVNTSGDLVAGIEGSTAGASVTGSAAYSAYIGTATSNPFYLVTGGTVRATVDSSGNVGIGVTPSYKLDTQVAGGADRSILRAAVTGVSGGFNVNWNHATLKTRVIIENIPTSAAGLAAGTLWNDAGTIKIA